MSMSASLATVKQRELNTHEAPGDREDVGGLIFKWARGGGVELKLEKHEMRESLNGHEGAEWRRCRLVYNK